MKINKTILIILLVLGQATLQSFAQDKYYQAVKFTDGKWLINDEFKSITVYSIDGLFSFNPPEKIDTIVSLSNSFIVPPFAEAHNHNIGTGVTEWDKSAIDSYLKAGVFYVKIQGNLPVSEEYKSELGINKPSSIDVQFAQGNITAPNGHPIKLIQSLKIRGYYRGKSIDSLNNTRYFTIDSEEDIADKWPIILKYKPDFIKILLANSNLFEKHRNDTTVWYKGLNPKFVPNLVARAHQNGFRITAHINNTFDFRHVLINKVDEIAHMPRMISGIKYVPISADDAKLAATNKTYIITTLAISLFQGGTINEVDFPIAKQFQAEDLIMLKKHGALVAIGSDDPTDTSVKEAMYLKDLNVFDNLELLRVWTGVTPKTIFPNRKIGSIEEGYEANFIVLEGNPIENFDFITKINVRFKQGYFIN
ncbi:MAG TPA: amidohydrolase family protein [Lunatimonas sp.]|nr:amidohydrolase family protein [Lunatimonas sp.]